MLRRSALVVCLACACGGTVETVHQDPASGGTGDSGGSSSGGVGAGGSPAGGAPTGGVGGTAGTGGGTTTGGRSGVEPQCPDIEPPPPAYECDPLDPYADCGPGEACYPYVSHPFGTGCGTQQFGSLCLAEGTGTHGDLCGDGHGRCAPGFLCVVGAGPGKRCAALCPLDGDHECPPGLICGETDIAGYGVCY
ncbi:MAG: hypothetical protein GX607_08055 [Myxococcales bacterium]|nr:hypothetical protein [Myxococcales bacterium]